MQKPNFYNEDIQIRKLAANLIPQQDAHQGAFHTSRDMTSVVAIGKLMELIEKRP